MFPLNTKILLAEDMKTVSDLVCNHLRGLGYKDIITARDGIQSWDLLEEHFKTGLPVGLVISDWNMPNMHGIDLLKKIRNSSDFKNLPFIILTADSDGKHVTEAVILGVSQYLLKPFTGAALKDKMEKAWKKHLATPD